MKFLKTEDAVSPVIGVILMVAITVILAAVIAAFVFGMAGSVSKTKTVAATARQGGTTGNDILVTWQGGQDNAMKSSCNISVTRGTDQSTAGPIKAPGTPPVVGNTTNVANYGSSAQDHVVVVAVFNDGSAQVILNTYV